jgi:hypothetical protein
MELKNEKWQNHLLTQRRRYSNGGSSRDRKKFNAGRN